ncbi:MAG: hypothetical protein CTY38_01290 [Methylotenera sp.]|nr:MAG: hypothetical protein CTY38_01290 [Methylotenera sp.]
MLTNSQQLALNQYLIYHPSHVAFEDVVQMIRRDSLNIRLRPAFTNAPGSIGDMVIRAECDLRTRNECAVN